MIKMGQKMNQYAPLADKHTGERRKVLHLGDLGNPIPEMRVAIRSTN